MRRIFAPQRFSSFLLLFCLFFVGQSFTPAIESNSQVLKNVIIEIDDVFFTQTEGGGPIWVAGNPTTNGSWVKVMGEGEIIEFVLIDQEGVTLAQEDINHDGFRFSPQGFDSGIYYMHFFINGGWYVESLLIE